MKRYYWVCPLMGMIESGTTAVTAEKLNTVKKQYQVNSYFDEKNQSPYYTYKDSEGVFHEIWLENGRSLNLKLETIAENNLGGISFWRIGTGFKDLYHLLDERGK